MYIRTLHTGCGTNRRRHFTFSQMYEYIKDRGYAIYPGKVTEAETFRIGNIGEIYKEDIEKVCAIMKEFLEEYNHEED